MNRATGLLGSTVGMKMAMAVTGGLMLLFLAGHLLGNSTVFAGAEVLNAYASKLQGLGPFVWAYRIFLAMALLTHVFSGVSLTLADRASGSGPYAVKSRRTSTFAGRNMIWTGLVIAAFILYHLLHFTFHLDTPGVESAEHLDHHGRHDVFGMVVMSFQNPLIAVAYAVGLSCLGLHLFHGIQSLFQTLGLTGDRSFAMVKKAGRIAAVFLLAGYLSIPALILAGVVGH